MAAHTESQWRLGRPSWRSRAIQVVTALLCLALPVAFAPAALHEEPTGLWMRAGLPQSVVQRLVLPGGMASYRYALVAGEGAYQLSREPGATWQSVDRDLPSRRWNNVEARVIAADPGDSNVVYVGMGGAGSRDPARSAGLYVTADGGRTWQSPVKSAAGEEVQAIAVMPGAHDPAAVDSVVCALTVSAIYCNTGAEQSWVRLDWRGTERVLSMAIRPGDPATIYIGTAGFGLVTTTDAGRTWKQSHVELQSRQIYDIVTPVSSPDTLFVATDAGLFKSVDAGSTWTRLGGPLEGRRVNTIALCPGVTGPVSTLAGGEATVLCVGLQHGAAYRSTDGGRNWVPLNRGLGSMTVLSLAVDPQDPAVLWAGTTDGAWRCSLPAVGDRGVPSLSPSAVLQPSPPARPQPSPSARLAPSPTMAPTATSVSVPALTRTVTRTVQLSATLTPSPGTTLTPTSTAPSAPRSTATRAVPPSPTRTPAPSSTPTSTEAPLPPPGPSKPRPSPTRVPR